MFFRQEQFGVLEDMHLERMICTTAVSDLSAAIERRGLSVVGMGDGVTG